MAVTTDQAKTVATFWQAWQSLWGVWYRLDKGVSGGRNANFTAEVLDSRWRELHEAYLATDEPTAKMTARYGYAERRVKLGREDAEGFKTFTKSKGEW